MNLYQKKVYLVRHGETEWTIKQKHTGLTDIDLTERGRLQAESLRKRLEGKIFAKVLVSPLKRALETCKMAGFFENAEILSDLVEWNYGLYEGKTSQEISQIDPDWSIFSKGAPGGESLKDIEQRAMRVLKKIDSVSGDLLLFSSGHFIRTLAAKWLHLQVQEGRLFLLSTASISILGYEKKQNVIIRWNDTGDLL